MTKVIVEQNYTINDESVYKQFVCDEIAIYTDRYDQVARIVNNKTGEVVASIYINPSSCEGGGGDLTVESGL